MTAIALPALSAKILSATVIIAGLGYFVDMYDLFLFNVVRVASLTELGLSGTALTDAGIFIAYIQMTGLLLGAYTWGVLGDRLGRKKCMLGSILIYSIGMLLCALVQTVDQYAAARAISAFGLAGELGVGVALVSEKLTAARRGYGVMIFITLGYMGVLTAAVTAEWVHWRDAYMAGAIAGLLLLMVRSLLLESPLFHQRQDDEVKRGSLWMIIRQSSLRRRYLVLWMLLPPAMLSPQLIWTLSPELGAARGLLDVKAPVILAIGFGCGAVFDLLAQFLSEKMKSRRMPVLVFVALSIASLLAYFTWPVTTMMEFYVLNGLVASTYGIWMLVMNMIAEQFGTNQRATAATTLPNFTRALVIPMYMVFAVLKQTDALMAAAVISTVIMTAAVIGWLLVPESYGKDLDYVER